MNDPKQENIVFVVIRWTLYLPVAFLVAILPPGIVSLFMEQAGLEDWYVWFIYGVLYAPSFMVIALFIAPRLNAFAKWSAVVFLLLNGLIIILGAYIGDDNIVGFVGFALTISAIIFAIMPLQKWAWLKKAN